MGTTHTTKTASLECEGVPSLSLARSHTQLHKPTSDAKSETPASLPNLSSVKGGNRARKSEGKPSHSKAGSSTSDCVQEFHRVPFWTGLVRNQGR